MSPTGVYKKQCKLTDEKVAETLGGDIALIRGFGGNNVKGKRKRKNN